MIKIGTLTFHGAYNYGSVCQTYALQEFVKEIGKRRGVEIDYSVINFRTQFQKELYWQVNRPLTIGNIVKQIMRIPYVGMLKKQARGYEEFLRKFIKLTDEVNEKSIERFADIFDYYISGSDQIFNVRGRDFAYPYLLNFTNSANKISYAASLGPLMIDWDKYDKEKYVGYLKQFKHLSVREQKSKDMVDELLESDISQIHVDPTLLLKKEQWRKVQSERNYNNGQYIFIYCLEPTSEHLRIADELSKALSLPVVCTGYRCKHDYFNSFVKLYDAGPADFLSLIDNAAIVLTSSFHGTAFSVIYDKPFWVIDGMHDNRIANLLKITGHEGNSIPLKSTFDFKGNRPLTASDTNAYAALAVERDKSENYFVMSLGLK